MAPSDLTFWELSETLPLPLAPTFTGPQVHLQTSFQIHPSPLAALLKPQLTYRHSLLRGSPPPPDPVKVSLEMQIRLKRKSN